MPGHLTYVKGDLFTTSANIIAHSVNCRGAFGSGVAGQMARFYPLARLAYLDKFKKEGWRLGDIQYVLNNKKKKPPWWIANMATQDTYGGPGVHVDYNAIESCFGKLFNFALCSNPPETIAIPQVGAGLANGNWPTIEGIIRDLLTKYEVDVTCYLYEK